MSKEVINLLTLDDVINSTIYEVNEKVTLDTRLSYKTGFTLATEAESEESSRPNETMEAETEALLSFRMAEGLKGIGNELCDWLIFLLALPIPESTSSQTTQTTESEAESEEKGNVLILVIPIPSSLLL